MKQDKVLFGDTRAVAEQTKNPGLIERRISQIEASNKNKSQTSKKVNKKSKDLNHNHSKHL